MQVSPEDILAFADRTIDTIEDVFMHATRAFMPAAKMNLPLSSDGQEEPPLLTATKKERIVVLGTGWGGHAISKVRVLLLRGPESSREGDGLAGLPAVVKGTRRREAPLPSRSLFRS